MVKKIMENPTYSKFISTSRKINYNIVIRWNKLEHQCTIGAVPEQLYFNLNMLYL